MIGKWVLIDIETSGVDPSQDQVIDLGFVVYEEQQRLKEFSLRIKTDKALDPLIVALTGLTVPLLQSQGKSWEEIALELQILQGAVLIAHNASFEESFLKSIFEKYEILPKVTDKGKYFHDSLEIFPFMLPYFPRLGLESINQIFRLWPKELHQGLKDSTDLADALIYAQIHTPQIMKEKIIQCEHLSSWWKNWVMIPFHEHMSKKPISSEVNKQLAPQVTQWNPENLTQFSDFYPEKLQKWLSLKLIQMIGRGISGMVTIPRATPLDLHIVYNVAINYIHHFKNKKIVLCTSYFSPDEDFWFDQHFKTISIDQMSCEIFKKHALELSKILNTEDQQWSKDLMNFYSHENPQYGIASRVPDLWCRQEPAVDVLWRSCRYLAKKKLKKIMNEQSVDALIVLQPIDLDILPKINDVTTIFWQAKQLEWNTDFNVEKIRFYDLEHIIIICSFLEILDRENNPLITDAKKLFEEFNHVLLAYIENQQDLDQKRIFWDVDFSELSRKNLSTWKNQSSNFLARRNNLKKYQSELLDALWSQLDYLLEQMLMACTSNSFGLSWKAGTDKKIWEIWNWKVNKLDYAGAKIFLDNEFDEESKDYWNDLLSLNLIEKSKRFDKIQKPTEDDNERKFSIKIWEDVQPSKLITQVKELSQRGRILICSQDQVVSTNIYSALVKEGFNGLSTWSEFLRENSTPAPKIVFCWEKDFRLISISQHLWLNFDFMIVDRVPDLAWFAWAQAAWKNRVKNFSMSGFEAYWCRRAGMLRERYLSLATLINAKELIVFDSRKTKWKGDSWKILSSYIDPHL